MKISLKPELVCPAGNWPCLLTALDSGADSVYFGIKGLNMRNLAENFDILEMKKIMGLLRKNKKKGYLALNVIITNQELDKVKRILKEAKSTGVDGVILWDMAVFSLAKKLKLPIHVSTQASISNAESLAFFARLGAKRAVLARECSLSDIKRITKYLKKEKIRCEVEAFIHGAMCVSVSGRCFLSSYSFGKSANKGECIQPCRREYVIKDSEEETEYILGKDYLLSPKDLCAIDFIDELIKAGITAFKIEGRKRSPEYIRVVTSSYRKAIDYFFQGKLTAAVKKSLKNELKTVYTRGFSSGFYFGRPEEAVSRKLEHSYEKVYLGEVTKFYRKINVAEILVRNESLKKGDQLIIMGKNTPVSMVVADQIQQNHIFVDEVGKGERAGLKIHFAVKPKDKVFLWQKKQVD